MKTSACTDSIDFLEVDMDIWAGAHGEAHQCCQCKMQGISSSLAVVHVCVCVCVPSMLVGLLERFEVLSLQTSEWWAVLLASWYQPNHSLSPPHY